MGWASGSGLAERVWQIVKPHLRGKGVQQQVAEQIVDAFEGEDCDTMNETSMYELAFPNGRDD